MNNSIEGLRDDATTWQEQVKPFKTSDVRRSVWQLVNTLVPYFATWALMIWSLDHSIWITIGATFLAGLLTVRLFIINHDCGHGSFFKSRKANDIVGFWTALLVVTPYLQWRHGHALHHAKSGKIEDRGVGYFWIMTLQEYQDATPARRAWCRFYRNPFILLIFGGFYLFVLEFRFTMRSDSATTRRQVYLTNLCLAGILAGGGALFGYTAFITLFLSVISVATTIGLWLFYLQHHYEGAYWGAGDDWDYEKAALQGSSYLKMNPLFEWFAGYINYHHIHHLVPKVPNYKLREAHCAVDTFRAVQPLTTSQILNSWRFRLVDEDSLQWVDFTRGERRRAEASVSELPTPSNDADNVALHPPAA